MHICQLCVLLAFSVVMLELLVVCSTAFNTDIVPMCRATFDTDNIDIGPERRNYLDHRLSRVWEMNSEVCDLYQTYQASTSLTLGIAAHQTHTQHLLTGRWGLTS